MATKGRKERNCSPQKQNLYSATQLLTLPSPSVESGGGGADKLIESAMEVNKEQQKGKRKNYNLQE